MLTMKSKAKFLILFLFVALQGVAQKPNIVFILADDWGWTDWQMNGAPQGSTFYETPNLNSLAKQGMYFNQAYVHPLCSPTRAALLTGKYPGARLKMHVAITGSSVPNPSLPASCNSQSPTCYPSSINNLPLSEITLAEELKKAGYSTHHFGKWHLGDGQFDPNKQGFDTQFAVGGAGPGSGGYFAPYAGIKDIPQGPNGEYLTERLTNEVCAKIEQEKNRPFFIYLAHYNVHSPYEAKPDLVTKYKQKAANQSATARHRHPEMGAMVESLDASIGKINACLEQLGLDKNTILVVMGDNGGVAWTNDKNRPTVPVTSNFPLRSGKSSFYEGGVRVPLIVKYPTIVPTAVTQQLPVHIIDFYPTLLELAGTKASPEKDVIDGKSIVPLLKNTVTATDQVWKNRPLFCHFPRAAQVGAPVGGSFIRQGDFKLYRYYGFFPDGRDKYELYNLATDISETRDLAGSNAELVGTLTNKLNTWLKDTKALVPRLNPAFNPSSITQQARLDGSKVVDGVSNTHENGNLVDYFVYPNPGNEIVSVDLEAVKSSEVEINITDLSGKVVKQTKFESAPRSAQIPINGISDGQYLIQIKAKNYPVVVKKITINR